MQWVGEISSYFYVFFLLIATAILFTQGIVHIHYLLHKNKFRVQKKQDSKAHKIAAYCEDRSCIGKLITYTARKLSMFNANAISKNREYAVIFLVSIVLVLVLLIIIMIPLAILVWYVWLAYIAVAMVFTVFLFNVFCELAKLRFTSKLPETFKIICARYMLKENIVKAIHISLEDFDKAVKKEMRKVYNVLNKNDMKEVEDTFTSIQQIYKNEHLTLLLNLIFQARYKGGDRVIKKQFEHVTEEMLISIENQKDLSVTARTYIMMALLLPLAMWGLEKFNHAALEEGAYEFYASPTGLGMKIIIYSAALIYMGVMLLLEKTT